jgi:methionyl-tRNA formyltransferase
MSSAVVFAYHDVGVRCLSVLLAHDIDVRLVLTHDDNPNENIWFGSVEKLARRHGLKVIKPADPNVPDVTAQIRAAQPDFLFSFYYRSMLGGALLSIPRNAALNMHGSLLPRYRGRVPVNWAIVHGETETGASLHHMTVKPDAGDVVDRESVPILPDDTALDVFRKVSVAAELCLYRALPLLVNGTANSEQQDLSKGNYFGGRTAADGAINWSQSAQQIHNLVRAVAPPYPGATAVVGDRQLRLLRTVRAFERTAPFALPTLYADGADLCVVAGDGKVLRVVELEIDARPIDTAQLAAQIRTTPIRLT